MPSSSKLCWVDVHGVPLICWSKAFFKRLGDLVGETLWIDEETEQRKRLDVGKILISAPSGESLTREVEVLVGGRSFPVKLVEQTTQLSIGWLSNHLKVKPHGSNLNNSVNKDDFGLFSREACPVVGSGSDRCREGLGKVASDSFRGEKNFRKDVREQVSKNNIRLNGEAIGGSGVGKEKGKSVWIPSRKFRAYGRNGSIRFKSQSGLDGRNRRDRMDSSSSSSDPAVGPKSYFKKHTGECSIGPTRWWKESGPSLGLCGDGLHGASGEDAGVQKYSKGLGQSVEARKASTVSNQFYDSLSDDNGEEMESEDTQSTLGGKDDLSIQVVPETQFSSDRGIELMVDLREKGDCGEEQISGREKITMEEMTGQGKEDNQRKEGVESNSGRRCSGNVMLMPMKKPRGKKNPSSVKIHPMVTRGLKGLCFEKSFKDQRLLPESRFVEVAELKYVFWLDVKGQLETKILSSKTNYVAYLVFKFANSRRGFESRPIELSVYPEGSESETRRNKKVVLDPPRNSLPRPYQRRGDGWMEIEMGGQIEIKKEGEEEKNKALDKVLFEQFKHTNAEKRDAPDELETPIEDSVKESRKRRNPFAGSDNRLPTQRPFIILGDDSKYKRKGRKKGRKESLISNKKPRPHYNHYANGSGWWDSGMEGIDDEEVGFGEAWEGVGCTTFGGIEWH
ncbi:hypothetical protein Q3G72_029178 [Acer saccharum]|nr:hypothetical protein Q3G72_029178 [Acer saccharum]